MKLAPSTTTIQKSSSKRPNATKILSSKTSNSAELKTV
jgi:hypothetical protein